MTTLINIKQFQIYTPDLTFVKMTYRYKIHYTRYLYGYLYRYLYYINIYFYIFIYIGTFNDAVIL